MRSIDCQHPSPRWPAPRHLSPCPRPFSLPPRRASRFHFREYVPLFSFSICLDPPAPRCIISLSLSFSLNLFLPFLLVAAGPLPGYGTIICLYDGRVLLDVDEKCGREGRNGIGENAKAVGTYCAEIESPNDTPRDMQSSAGARHYTAK